jgi:hypothetical protein
MDSGGRSFLTAASRGGGPGKLNRSHNLFGSKSSAARPDTPEVIFGPRSSVHVSICLGDHPLFQGEPIFRLPGPSAGLLCAVLKAPGGGDGDAGRRCRCPPNPTRHPARHCPWGPLAERRADRGTAARARLAPAIGERGGSAAPGERWRWRPMILAGGTRLSPAARGTQGHAWPDRAAAPAAVLASSSWGGSAVAHKAGKGWAMATNDVAP